MNPKKYCTAYETLCNNRKESISMKKRYALAGASGRGYRMYGNNIINNYSDVAEIVGIFDPNYLRAGFVRDNLDKNIPTYTDFDKMIEETKPDCVIVTTMDSFHHEFIIRSLDAGCDVICEKPMTIDAEKNQQILDAEKRNNRKIIVTFNYRYIPYVTKVKELIREGAIGDVVAVDYEWLLDKHHGADYFRRWHKWQKNGGGLFVTKATHHFDMVNWWIEQDPVKVYANGALSFYGPQRAFEKPQVRCKGCPYISTCELAYTGFDDISTRNVDPRISKMKDYLKGMYFDAESVDGYYRDQCLWADCDIYDNMSATVTYSGGAILTYSLQAFSPLEGVKFAINGTYGRIEGEAVSSDIGHTELSFQIRVYNHKGEMIQYKIPQGVGSHGGGDARMLDKIFRGNDEDPLNHMAGSRDGAMSVLIGAAANTSVKEDRPVYIKDMVTLYE